MGIVGVIAVTPTVASLAANTATNKTQPIVRVQAAKAQLVQGKDVKWWASHAVQSRKEANANARLVKQLQKTLAYNPSVQESIKLATMIYPSFTEARAWRIIKHESWMTADPLHAYNRQSVNGCHATGLYQFLDCTFRSTPFGNMSIYSPYAQSLAAGWMHENGRGCEWQISPLPTNCHR
jgi:hypothetical protein